MAWLLGLAPPLSLLPPSHIVLWNLQPREARNCWPVPLIQPTPHPWALKSALPNPQSPLPAAVIHANSRRAFACPLPGPFWAGGWAPPCPQEGPAAPGPRAERAGKLCHTCARVLWACDQCVRASVCGFGGGADWEPVSGFLVRMAREAPATQSKGHWSLLMREGQRQTPPWPLEPGNGGQRSGGWSQRLGAKQSMPGVETLTRVPEPAHQPPWTPRGLQAGAPRPSVSRAGSMVGVHDFQAKGLAPGSPRAEPPARLGIWDAALWPQARL